ncbi:HK97 family phage prohead protease [Yinghuangia aomiensis]
MHAPRRHQPKLFSFRVLDQDWSYDTDERALRTITDVYLYDVSPVTYPAYLDTTSGVSEASRRAYRAAMDARTTPPLVLDRARDHDHTQLSLTIEVLNIP